MINHARWDHSLPVFMARQLPKRTFRSYMLANLRAHHLSAMPVLYRLAWPAPRNGSTACLPEAISRSSSPAMKVRSHPGRSGIFLIPNDPGASPGPASARRSHKLDPIASRHGVR